MKYRDREFTVDEAMIIMKEDFVENETKLDPILFSIFIDYIKDHAFLKKNIQ